MLLLRNKISHSIAFVWKLRAPCLACFKPGTQLPGDAPCPRKRFRLSRLIPKLAPAISSTFIMLQRTQDPRSVHLPFLEGEIGSLGTFNKPKLIDIKEDPPNFNWLIFLETKVGALIDNSNKACLVNLLFRLAINVQKAAKSPAFHFSN